MSDMENYMQKKEISKVMENYIQKKEISKMRLLEICKVNNQFAFDLYAKLQAKKGNLFFSPASIITALAMVYAGARGQTEIQLKDTLHFTFPQEELHAAFAKWISELIRDGNKFGNQLKIANALWGRKGYEFLQTFLEILKTNYNSELRETDFGLPAEAANQINSWVAEHTENKIKNIVRPDMFDSLTRLVLANTIYFNGIWEAQFEEHLTHDSPFILEDDSSNQTIRVSMMTIEEDFNYSEGEDFQAIELPYIGKFSLIVFLPKKETAIGFKKLFGKMDEENSLQKFEQKFTLETFNEWQPKRMEKVKVFLPKFKVSLDFELSHVLSEMGIKDAFSPDDADFSGISNKEPLNISQVLHKAWVEVNEKGTEAAVATGLGMCLGAAAAPPPKPKIFRADHPFLFLICRKFSNDILFMGRVMNPQE